MGFMIQKPINAINTLIQSANHVRYLEWNSSLAIDEVINVFQDKYRALPNQANSAGVNIRDEVDYILKEIIIIQAHFYPHKGSVNYVNGVTDTPSWPLIEADTDLIFLLNLIVFFVLAGFAVVLAIVALFRKHSFHEGSSKFEASKLKFLERNELSRSMKSDLSVMTFAHRRFFQDAAILDMGTWTFKHMLYSGDNDMMESYCVVAENQWEAAEQIAKDLVDKIWQIQAHKHFSFVEMKAGKNLNWRLAWERLLYRDQGDVPDQEWHSWLNKLNAADQLTGEERRRAFNRLKHSLQHLRWTARELLTGSGTPCIRLPLSQETITLADAIRQSARVMIDAIFWNRETQKLTEISNVFVLTYRKPGSQAEPISRIYTPSGDLLLSLVEQVWIYVTHEKPLKAAKRLASVLRMILQAGDDVCLSTKELAVEYLEKLQLLLNGNAGKLGQIYSYVTTVRNTLKEGPEMEQHARQNLHSTVMDLIMMFQSIPQVETCRGHLRSCLSSDILSESVQVRLKEVEAHLLDLIRQAMDREVDFHWHTFPQVAWRMLDAVSQQSSIRQQSKWKTAACSSEVVTTLMGCSDDETEV